MIFYMLQSENFNFMSTLKITEKVEETTNFIILYKRYSFRACGQLFLTNTYLKFTFI